MADFHWGSVRSRVAIRPLPIENHSYYHHFIQFDSYFTLLSYLRRLEFGWTLINKSLPDKFSKTNLGQFRLYLYFIIGIARILNIIL